LPNLPEFISPTRFEIGFAGPKCPRCHHGRQHQFQVYMIADFNNGACAWTDWNILLDESGGPNHVKNFCFAPVHADTRKGTLHYMNSYYYIGIIKRTASYLWEK